MDRREKLKFLLEQMRLCLAKHDYIRTQIISKKINIKAFEDESSYDLKLKYYELMIQMDLHDKNYFDACQHYKHYYDTPRIKQDEEKMKQSLKYVVLYLALSPYNNEQSGVWRLSVQTHVFTQQMIYCEDVTHGMAFPSVTLL
ncbi:unnamed protein product [Rotaria sp. Silwood2]|nr:unnamed protein product [Rotaria sp. Silwood2]